LQKHLGVGKGKVEGMIHQAPTIFYRKKEHPESLIQICHLSWYKEE
jgi:hypothetical protein